MTLESQLLDQRADLAGVRAQHESARLQAEAEHELAEKGIIPMLQYRRSQLLVDELAIRLDIERERIEKFEQTIEAQLLAEQARVEQLRNAEDLRRRQVVALDVRSPIAGILQQLAVEEGQQVAAGANLARVARPDDLVAELRVPETLAKDVRLGQRVTVDTRNGEAPGEVIRIDPAVRNGTVTVEVGFDGALPEGARPDLSVDGTIEIERLDDVLYVGRPAFGQPGETTTMFRLGPDGEAAQRVPVHLGRASVSVIEIVEGLEAGDRVVLSDTSAWDESDRLRLD
jgi:HlyD family secretion protein